MFLSMHDIIVIIDSGLKCVVVVVCFARIMHDLQVCAFICFCCRHERHHYQTTHAPNMAHAKKMNIWKKRGREGETRTWRGRHELEQRKMKNNNKIGIEIIEAFQMADPCHSLAHMERAVNYWANSNNNTHTYTHTIQLRHDTVPTTWKHRNRYGNVWFANAPHSNCAI